MALPPGFKVVSAPDEEEERKGLPAGFSVVAASEPAAPLPAAAPQPAEPEQYLCNEDGTVAGINPEWAQQGERGREAFVEGAGQGITFGFGDELQGALGAAMDKFLPGGRAATAAVAEATGEEAPGFVENYRGLRDAERANQAQLQEEEPGAFLTGQLGGAVVNPVNAIAPGTSLLRLAGRGAGEGAAYGLGETEELDNQAILDTVGGAALGGTTALGLGMLPRALGRRNVKQDLVDAEGNFRGLAIADEEGILGEGYRELVKRTYGGGDVLKKQQAPIKQAAAEAVDTAEDVLQGTKLGEKNILKRTIEQADQQAARQAIEEAIPKTMPQEVADAARSAPTAKEAEAIISDWFSENAFQSIKAYKGGVDGFRLPNNLTTQLKSLVGRNPEFKEALGPGQWKTLNAAIEKSKKTGGISGNEILELRNTFARAANKAPSLKGKGSRAVADKFDNIIKQNVEPEDFAAYQAELGSWGGKQALTKAAKSARKRGDDITAKDVARTARDRSGVQETAGAAVRAQQDAKAAMTAEALKANPRVLRAEEGVNVAKDEAARIKKLAGTDDASPLSKFFLTSILGGGITPIGAGVSAGLAAKPTQMALAGQAQWQEALRRALASGNMNEVTQILVRMNSAGQQ